MNVHKNFESLYEYVPREFLPEEYGGNGGTFEDIATFWAQKVIDNRDFIVEWDGYSQNNNLSAVEIVEKPKRRFWW